MAAKRRACPSFERGAVADSAEDVVGLPRTGYADVRGLDSFATAATIGASTAAATNVAALVAP